MGYSVNQYLHFTNIDNTNFMTQVDAGSVEAISVTSGSGEEAAAFSSPGLRYNSYQRGKSYFINCELGRTGTELVYYVKLMNSSDKTRQQFVKKITVQPGSASATNMMKLDFIFTPVETFDTLVFELERTSTDYISPRPTAILFRELSEINNILPILNIEKMLKIGVQATPGLKMCINNEEIQVGKTGVYELADDSIQVYSFSVVSNAAYNGTESELNAARNNTINRQNGYVHMKNNTNIIPKFILDYIYEEEA